MSESIILALDNGLLQKLSDADKAIEKLGTKTEQVTEQMIKAFKKVSSDGVDAFVKDVEGKIKNLNVNPIKVGLALDPKTIDDIKKQIAALGATIPVGANVTGTSGGGTTTDLSGVPIDPKVTQNLGDIISAVIDKVNQLNQVLIQTAKLTDKQLGVLGKQMQGLDYAKQKNSIKELTLAERERAKRALLEHKRRMLAIQREIDEQKRLAKAYKAMPQSLSTKGVGNLIAQSKQSTTINQRLVAINNLKNALKDLDTTDRRYQRTVSHLNEEIRRQERELRKLGHQMNKVKEHSNNLFNITGQLGRALSLMFSVSQITQYIRKMVNVRKEMELQQRSLQVLLQSKDDANKLWNQTLDLAVKSPFRVKELVTYTKQLAAYRIESDKLFETNKMLADVSAGLGVDMQRLILAFGQVKSASFLRGCLGKGTPIRLYNDDIKEVQNIVVGDVIMGDDSTPRNVKEVIYGKEQMYIVRQGNNGDDYRVNENHILTLKDKITGNIIDVYVKDYLKDKERYNGVKIGLNGVFVDYPIDVVKDKVDEYFGFVIDGNKRFLLGDGTITHNTELRQFTEAGIPMLEELAKYFGEIQGRAVSVAEVFDMISKRMVTFTDVEKVFQRMTSAGGVFFNMQEELSQTTSGMISNLQDSIDLMLNDMGKKNQGVINRVIKAARGLVDNWEAIGVVMKGTLVTLLLYKAATMNISGILDNIIAKWGNIKALGSLFKENPLEFLKTFKGNAIMFALTAIASLIIKIIAEHRKYKRAVREVEKAHEDMLNTVKDVELGFSDLFKSGEDSIDEYKGKLQELVNIADKQYNIEVDFNVNNLESITDVSNKFDELKAKIESFNNLSLQFSLDFVDANDRGWGWFQDFIGKDLTQLGEAQDEIEKVFYDVRTQMSGALKDFYNVDVLNKQQEKYFNKLIDFSVEFKVSDVIDKFKEVIGSQSDVEDGTDFADVLNGLNINTLTEEQKTQLESLVRGYIETEEALEKSKDKIAGLNEDILKSFAAKDPNKETSYDFLQREYKGLQSIVNEYDKLKNQYYLTHNAQDKLNFDNFLKVFSAEDVAKIRVELSKYRTDLNNASKELGDFYERTRADVQLKLDTELVGLSEENINKELSKNIYNALKNLQLEKEWDENIFTEMLSQAEKWYKDNMQLELDLIPKIQPIKPQEFTGLKDWQKKYNEIVTKSVEELKNTLDTDQNTEYIMFGALPITEDIEGYKVTQEKKLKEVEELLDEERQLLKNATDENGQLLEAYSNIDLNALTQKISLLEILWKWLGGEEDDKGKNVKEKKVKEQIALIRQLYEEYQKLSKKFSAQDSTQRVINSFSKAFDTTFAGTNLKIDDVDFTNLQGVLNALSKIEDKAKSEGEESAEAFYKAFGEVSVELDVIAQVKEREQFENDIKDMFSDYELSLELDKLNIPHNLASDLFGVDFIDLSEIENKLKSERASLEKENQEIANQIAKEYRNKEFVESLKLQAQGNKERLDDITKFEQQVTDLQRKQTEERLKTYTQYLLNEQHERVKIRMDTLRQLNEVEELYNQGKYTLAQYETITGKIKEDESKKLAQQRWKDFEQSPMYMQMFDDVENMGKGALESLISQMGTLKDELQAMGLPASDLKEILGAINKAEEELERRNPFKNFGENAKIAFTNAKRLRDLETQRAKEQHIYDNAKESYDNSQINLAEQSDVLDTLQKNTIEYETQKALVDILTKSTNHWSKEVDKAKSNLTETNNQINNINDSSNDFYKQLNDIGSITKSVVDGIFQITDAMSWLPEETQLSLERMKGLSDSAFTIAGGIGSIMSGDIIGGVTSLISGVSGLVSLFMEWSSGTKEATIQIERQNRILSTLQNKYDRLNKALDEAWNTSQIKEYNAELEKNLQQQIIAQKEIIAAQESVKGSDIYGSEQWSELQESKEELQNLYDMQQELQDNIYEKITGGIIDNTIDAVSSWVDVWYDAFKETGDGLKGLEDNFNEMLLNLVKRQAAMKVAGKFIDQWNAALERYADDGSLSFGEITSWANMIEQDLPALSSQLETFFNAFNGVLGDTQGNLSGLQRGIQGITEQQADILASYLNSIRFIVSDSNYQLKQLVASRGDMNRSESPMVEQLRVIANNTKMLYSLFDGMTSAHPSGGRGLRVVI